MTVQEAIEMLRKLPPAERARAIAAIAGPGGKSVRFVVRNAGLTGFLPLIGSVEGDGADVSSDKGKYLAEEPATSP